MVFITGAASLRTPASVTITGSGNETKCYATINGTKQYSAGTHEVNTGDNIKFGVLGKSHAGTVTIDGTKVLEATGSATRTYDWTVPYGISTIEIAMAYDSKLLVGTITVTTS